MEQSKLSKHERSGAGVGVDVATSRDAVVDLEEVAVTMTAGQTIVNLEVTTGLVVALKYRT